MRRFVAWLKHRFSQRPTWMNALMVFAAFQVFIYSPFDLLLKPLARDEDVWFGIMLTGWAAKVGGLVHLAVYAAGLYGFWRMRPWMHPWAALYVLQLALAMFLWSVCHVGGFRGWLMGLASGAIFGALALALWRARDVFRKPVRPDYTKRYGQWAVVTGATAGIGLEFARALASRGVSCVLAARRADRLEAVAEELKTSHGIEVRVVPIDLASEEGPEQLADAVEDLEVGMLFSNAGVGYAGRFEKQELPRLKQMVALNCTANVSLISRMLPGMLARRRGAIVITGSVAGRQPVPFHGLYAATKGFELLLGEALWAEVCDRGIDVLVVQPGPVATEFEHVAGEVRQNPAADESPQSVVETALDALGKQPSVVTGWFNWVRANVNRVAPRTVAVCAAADFMEGQTPPSMR
ncbi:MAG: SDR family NAD(P)-dependent oxidoreductase [Candidatus Binatia bacterium]